MDSRNLELLKKALKRVKDETELPLFVEAEINKGSYLYTVKIATHRLTPERPEPLAMKRLNRAPLTVKACCTFLNGLRLGWLYGAKKLRLAQEPPLKRGD